MKNALDLKKQFKIKNVMGFRTVEEKNEIKVIELGGSKYLTYLAGNCLIFSNLKSKQQIVIPGTPGTYSIVNYCINKNNNLLAISEKTKDSGMITVYEIKYKKDIQIKQKRVFWSNEFRNCYFSHMQFLYKQYLIGVTEGEQKKVCLWDFEKGKLKQIQVIQGLDKVNNIFLTNKNDHILFVYGKTNKKSIGIKTFQIKILKEEYNINQKFDYIQDFITNSNKDITCHAFLEQQYICFGTDGKDLLIMNKQNEIKIKQSIESQTVKSIIKWKDGFLVVGKNLDIFQFKQNFMEIKYPFQKQQEIISSNLYANKGVIQMIGLSQQSLVAGLVDGQMINVSFNQKQKQYDFKDQFQSFHQGMISDLDICPLKPLIASVGNDMYLKIYNYEQQEQLYNKNLNKIIKSISFHPTGLHIAIAQKSKIIIYDLCIDGLNKSKTINIKSNLVSFSNGGSLIAIVNDKNIQFFDFYKNKTIDIILKGHSHRISDIKWEDNDYTLYSASIDGNIIKWNIFEKKKTILINKEQTFSSWDISPQTNYLILNSLQPEIKIIKLNCQEDKQKLFGNSQQIKQKNQLLQLDDKISSVLINSDLNMLFMSTGDDLQINQENYKHRGALIIMEQDNLKQYFEINCCVNGIKKMFKDKNNNNLFVIGFDNSLIQISIQANDAQIMKNQIERVNINNEFLFSKFQLVKKLQKINSLNQNVMKYEKDNELKIQKQNELRQIQIDRLSSNIQAQKNNFKSEVKDIQIKISKVQQKSNDDQQQLIEIHKDKLQNMKVEQKQKLQIENKKYQKIKQKNDKIKSKLEEEMNLIKQNFEENIEKLKQNKENELSNIETNISEIKKKQIQKKNFYDKDIIEIEKNLDNNIKNYKKKYEKQKLMIQQEKYILENKVNTEKKMYNEKKKDKMKEEGKQEDIDDKIQIINEQIQQEKMKYSKNEIDISEKEYAITQKIQRIESSQKKRQELQKSKFILDYKIKELKKEKGPREEEIAKMKQKLHNMQIEINQFLKKMMAMRLSVNEYHLKLQGQSNQIKKSEITFRNLNIFLENFQSHLTDLILNHLDDYKRLKTKLLFLYNNYVNEQMNKVEQVDKKKAFQERRAYLESCIKTLKDKFVKNIQVHKNDNKRIMKENVDLINAINELKREKKFKEENTKKIDQMKRNSQIEIEICLQIKKNKKLLKEYQIEIQNIMKNK